MRKEITIGVCFVVAGILCACFFGYEYFTTYGFLNEYHMRSFVDAKLDTVTLLGDILWERGKLFVFLWVLSYTPARKVIPLVLRCGICFTGGVFLAACMINMGIMGLLFFVLSWIPHGIIYLIVLYLMLRSDRHRYYQHSDPVPRRIAATFGLVIVFVFGCVSEATVGVWLMQKLITLLY